MNNKAKAALAAAALAVTAVTVAPTAQAIPQNCESIAWGFLGGQTRTICDGAVNKDQSWTRQRLIWTPAHNVPTTTSCYSTGYSYITVHCTTSGGYYQPETVQEDQQYLVFPDNVLPNEPGHLA